jgi:hypothetical protein
VAKKVRTPPPPRRVQAPQKRDPRKAPGGAGRPPWLYAAAGAAAALVVAAVVVGFAVLRDDGGGNTETRAANTNYNSLPGIRRTKAPWPPEYEFLADRLLPLSLNPLPEEGAATHIHSHLDIFVEGKRVTVPASIGINPGAEYLTELHTHDTRGVLHIESPEENDEFTLGQFFAQWGVFLNGRCVGAYCDNLRWYVNGKPQTGNPANLLLKAHQQVAIVVGKAPAKVPASYAFQPNE